MADCKDCRYNVTCIDRRFFGGNIKNCGKFMDIAKYVEVVHANWEDGYAVDNQGNIVYKSIDCSHCHEIFKTDDREYWKERFKVCPFCGALMDGGIEDGG